jgi:murein endopeptidase
MYGSAAVVTALSVALTCATVVKSAARVQLPPSNPLKNNEQEKQQKSKPAMVLFSQKQLPSLGRAMAIGYYPRGCLQGGIELPHNGADLAGDASIS